MLQQLLLLFDELLLFQQEQRVDYPDVYDGRRRPSDGGRRALAVTLTVGYAAARRHTATVNFTCSAVYLAVIVVPVRRRGGGPLFTTVVAAVAVRRTGTERFAADDLSVVHQRV